jgi:UPF0716 protein FxsA
MLLAALAILIALVAAELYVIILVAHAIGILLTVVALLASTVAGLWLVRGQRIRAWGALRDAVRNGAIPDRELGDAALIVIGAVLITVPGFITDALGMLAVAPPTRRVLRGLLGVLLLRRAPSAARVGVRVIRPARAWRRRAGRRAARIPGATPGGTVIPGEVIESDVAVGDAGARATADGSGPPAAPGG